MKDKTIFVRNGKEKIVAISIKSKSVIIKGNSVDLKFDKNDIERVKKISDNELEFVLENQETFSIICKNVNELYKKIDNVIFEQPIIEDIVEETNSEPMDDNIKLQSNHKQKQKEKSNNFFNTLGVIVFIVLIIVFCFDGCDNDDDNHSNWSEEKSKECMNRSGTYFKCSWSVWEDRCICKAR